MSEKSLSRWLKFIILLTSVCSAVVYFLFIPIIGHAILYDYPEMSSRFWPWLIFVLLTGVPCYLALAAFFRICIQIGKDNSFSEENARSLKHISVYALVDAMFVFLVNLVYLLLNMNHFGMFLALLIVAFAGVAIAVVAAGLSHLV